LASVVFSRLASSRGSNGACENPVRENLVRGNPDVDKYTIDEVYPEPQCDIETNEKRPTLLRLLGQIVGDGALAGA